MTNAGALALLLLLFCTLSTAPKQAAAMTCQQVFTSISGCISFARGVGGAPPPGCCAGAGTLTSELRSTSDRQQGCRCLQSIIRSIPGVNLDKVAAIPALCRVSVPYPISLSVDCSKVK